MHYTRNKIIDSQDKINKNILSKASFFQPKLSISPPNDIHEQEADAMAEKIMRMPVNENNFFKPANNIVQRKCAHCEEEEKNQIQKKSANTSEISAAPFIVNDVIHSNGHPLDGSTKSFMESGFGYDFSNVEIHDDSLAHQSSSQINALAYTHGNHIVFGEGQYQPNTPKGKQLLAHELTHVVQQNSGIVSRQIQRACFESSNPSKTISPCAEGSTDVGRQVQGQPNRRDARANAIIATAQNTAVSLQDRALQVVNDIICAYMPSQAGKVRKILYYSGEPGLFTQRVGTGATAQGDICVGDSFVNNTTNAGISRRVLQVAHELEHIDQYRGGMAGDNKHDEREFLAFTDEALADEFIGTGRMADATRKDVIDGAIGYYYCLSSALQTQYASRLQNLLTRRQTVNGTHGNASTNPPANCRRLR